jgi:glycosyltransferase involved in cell wall biosynthesis
VRIGVNTLFLIPGGVGGTETYLCQTLAAIAQYHGDIGLVLFTNSENDSFLKQRFAGFPRIEFMNLGFAAENRYSRIIREQVQLPPLVRKSGVDVLWSPGYTAPFSAACPQVVTIHDMQYKTHPQDMTFLARITTDVLVRMAARRCRRIIAVSNFARQEIMRYTAARADAVDVTYEAADAAFGNRISEDSKNATLGRLGLAGTPYILCVSNTYPHKNIRALVEAFGNLLTKIPHRLVIIGRPRLGEPAVQAAIGALADKSRVSRIDWVLLPDMPAIYQGADLFVFPSLYEGFGLPVLEAMMAGVPVVTINMASIPEVGGENVFYSDGTGSDLAAKMMAALAMDATRRKEWCSKAATRAKSFSWQATADKTVGCLKKAVVTERDS